MIRIGLLGAAWITPMAIIEPAKLLAGVEVTAVAARDPQRAQEYALEHGIKHVEADYQALLARPDIDLIYIALPVSLHAQWAGHALAAGKHVLCEKPLVMNATEARELALIAKNAGKHLIEAFHYRHHPYFKRIQAIVASRELGPIRTVSGRLHVPVPPREGQIRHDLAMGGGALMDLGCYPVNMLRSLCGGEPTVKNALAEIGPTGVDLSIRATLAFSDGVEGLVDCAMPEIGALAGELIVECERGRIDASKPILPHLGGILHIESPQGKREESADPQSTFFYQLQAVAKMLKTGSPNTSILQDSIANATVLDAIRKAANI